MLKYQVKQFGERALKKLLSSQRINEKLNHIQEEQSKINKPIFIVGCGRSGTTLLFQLLKQHPQLVGTTGYPDGEDHIGWIKPGT